MSVERPMDLSKAEQDIWLSVFNSAVGRASPDLFNPHTYITANLARIACAVDAADTAVVSPRHRTKKDQPA